jgi:hypothetical protein
MKHIRKYNEEIDWSKFNVIKNIKDKRDKDAAIKNLNDKFEALTKSIDSYKSKSEFITDIKIVSNEVQFNRYSGQYDIKIKAEISLSNVVTANINKKIVENNYPGKIGKIGPVVVVLKLNGDGIVSYEHGHCQVEIPDFDISDGKVISTGNIRTIVELYSISYSYVVSNIYDIEKIVNKVVALVIDNTNDKIKYSFNNVNNQIKDSEFISKIDVDVLINIMIDLIDMSEKYSIDQYSKDQSGANPWFLCVFTIPGIKVLSQKKSEISHRKHQDISHTFDSSMFPLNDKNLEVMDALIVVKKRLTDIYKEIVVNVTMKDNYLKLEVFNR